ncbi:hypothetical protein BVX97_01265 [bacterium E08(2017)]|nr:hypothetical protein BVX97_01265 [bacterium E08(2017)]
MKNIPNTIIRITATVIGQFVRRNKPRFFPTILSIVTLLKYSLHQLLDVIQADTGTGKRARIDGVRMAGKTGTAQYGGRGSGKQHTWMIVFAPYEKPQYAVAMIIEDGVSGGQTVAPKIKQLMQGVFQEGDDA